MVARNKKRRRVIEDSGDEEMKEMEKTEMADLQQKNEDLLTKVEQMQKVLVSKTGQQFLDI